MKKTTHDTTTPPLTRSQYGDAYYQGFAATRRFLVSKGIDLPRAEDIAQAAWARGWERLEELRNPERVVPWVNTIAFNVFRNRLRRRKETEELPLNLIGGYRVSSDAIEAGQALAACNRTERALLVDRYVQGYSCKEVAAKYGLSSTAVRVRTLRARRKAAAVLTGGAPQAAAVPAAA